MLTSTRENRPDTPGNHILFSYLQPLRVKKTTQLVFLEVMNRLSHPHYWRPFFRYTIHSLGLMLNTIFLVSGTQFTNRSYIKDKTTKQDR